MRQATLHQLQILEAIARHGSFTRAAEELELTQPTVSQQIKRLTETIGMPLFEQLGKQIYLTAAGNQVLSASAVISEKFAELEIAIDELKGLKQGKINLVASTTAKYFVPRLLGTFRRKHPEIELALHITNQEGVLARLARNQDDLYFTGRPPSDLDIELRPILDNPLVVVAPSNHPLAGKTNIAVKELATEPFIFREAGSGTRLVVENFLAENRVAVDVVIELSSNEAIKQAIAGGLGLSVLSQHSLDLETQNGLLTILNVEGFPIQRHWYVIYPTGKQLSVAAQTFLDFSIAQGKQIIEQFSADLIPR
ncbi:LysR substrate-binding domain-containing protein [Chamaesiphon sp.]|uniref:LysR family transcriptional regulator n=1 Tax=Chamaesiphon sp. TaxID=2814140 RepID=UPI0035939D95